MLKGWSRGAAVLAAVLAGVVFAGAASRALTAQDRASVAPVSFNRDIQPILANTCYTCHGPDEKQRETKFHFDTREGAFKEEGIILPGDAARSALVRRITNEDPEERMPPPDSGHSLTEAQIDLLRRWIDEGATWDTHWAFVAPVRPELPAVRNRNWVRNPIDQFILARLEREGLKPSREADKATLLRRVTYDLTGLPPTPDEIDAFLEDRAPDAYERRVDELLQTPHYGERMAMPWLDAARYADTHGYHIDSHRDMWPWRDWVIGAFNRNLPFDQFVIEQLAGDLLPGATLDQKIASGFNRNHMINFEGGAIAEEYQVEYVVDRVETTATAFMGLTMGCARCHSHKFDPISHKEFYAFYAFFNNVPEVGLDGRTGNAVPFLPVPSPDQKARLAEIDAAIQPRELALADEVVGPLQRAWEASVAERASAIDADGIAAHYELDGSFSDLSGRYQHGRTVAGEPTFDPGQIGRAASFDGDAAVSFGEVGGFDVGEAFSMAVWLKGRGNQPMTVFRKMEGDQERRGYEWRLEDIALAGIQRWSTKLAITLSAGAPEHAIRIRTRARLRHNDWYHVALTYDGSGKASGLRLFLDGEPVAVDVERDALQGSIRPNAPLQVGSLPAQPFRGQIDDLRLYTRALTPDQVDHLANHYRANVLLAGLTGRRSPEEIAHARDYFLTHAAPDALRTLYRELQALRQDRLALEKQIPTVMVMGELEKPRETFVLGSGDYRNKGEKVQPGVPAVLPRLPADAPPTRLTLAQWMVDPQHPLTARVAVNRFWQIYFGHGIVKTQEDFGVQAEAPVHPALLDWLATEFVRTGWDVRAVQRLIVTSATYRQASKVTPALHERDPENRLLARGPRLRLPAEMIRDTALAASGLLNPAIGGPSVLPYQPPGLWEELAFGDGFSAQAYEQSRGEDLYRRGMYTFWKRTVPPASMATFDAPDREKCTSRRAQTNTPLQALVLMNDPAYVEAARALAERTLLEGGQNDRTRVTYAFRLATARKPSGKEMDVLRGLLRQRREGFSGSRKAALALLGVGESPRDRALDPAELAAWTTVASVILNLDETITKQ